MDITLDGWDIGVFADVEWSPWGSSGNARAKVLANGDGYFVALVEAEPGRGVPHAHEPIGFGVRQRPHEHRVDHGEDRGGRADAESEGEHGDAGEAGCAQQAACGLA